MREKIVINFFDDPREKSVESMAAYFQFLGLWERLHNPKFTPLEFEGGKELAGANAFTMSPKKWIEATGSYLAIDTCSAQES